MMKRLEDKLVTNRIIAVTHFYFLSKLLKLSFFMNVIYKKNLCKNLCKDNFIVILGLSDTDKF